MFQFFNAASSSIGQLQQPCIVVPGTKKNKKKHSTLKCPPHSIQQHSDIAGVLFEHVGLFCSKDRFFFWSLKVKNSP